MLARAMHDSRLDIKFSNVFGVVRYDLITELQRGKGVAELSVSLRVYAMYIVQYTLVTYKSDVSLCHHMS